MYLHNADSIKGGSKQELFVVKKTDKDTKTSLGHEYQHAYDAMREHRDTWDDKETILYSKLNDQFSTNTRKSQVTDGSLGNRIWERAFRVLGQLPTGVIKAASKKDKGKNALMNIIFNRYIIPNANSQWDYETKLKVWKVYAAAWGAAPMLYDYRVDDEYIGPDSWLINIRDFYPEPGKLSIKDCNWVMISTLVSREYLEAKVDKDGWDSKVIKRILKDTEDGTSPTKKNDTDKVGSNSPNLANEPNKNEIELVTKYERGKKGKWTTFAPDFEDGIVREIKNPHKNGNIPVVLLQNFPRIDSIIGLSDIERGETLQRAKDSLINLYLDGVKMSIFPPLKINPSGVQMSTIRNAPAVKWLMNDVTNVVEHKVSPQGISSFVQTYQFLDASALTLDGTTNTRISTDQGSVQQGKTPEALKQNQARENARDLWDRHMLETAVEELHEGFINLMAEKQEKPINIQIFEQEIAELEKQGLEDVAEVYESGENGKLTIKKSDIKAKYRYIIDAGTTMAKDEAEELQNLADTFALMSQNPQIAQEIQQEGYQYNKGEHLKRIFIKSGIQDWEKILEEVPEEDRDMMAQQVAEQQMMEQQQQEQMMAEQQAQAQQQQIAQALTSQDEQIRQLAEQAMQGGI